MFDGLTTFSYAFPKLFPLEHGTRYTIGSIFVRVLFRHDRATMLTQCLVAGA